MADTAAPARAKRKFLVRLPAVPDLIVEATTPEEAWERYKAKTGLIRTDHVPEIAPAD